MKKKDMIGSADKMESKIFHDIYDLFPDNTYLSVRSFSYYHRNLYI